MKKFKQFIDKKTIQHLVPVKKDNAKNVIPSPIEFHFGRTTLPPNISLKKENVDYRTHPPLDKWLQNNENQHMHDDNPDYEHDVTDGYNRRQNSHHVSKKLGKHVNLQGDELHHVRNYTDDSRELNNHLLDKHNGKSNPEHSEEYTKNRFHIPSEHISNAIKSNSLSHDLHIYSGVAFDPEKIKDSEGRMHSPAFLSFSHSKDVAKKFAAGKNVSKETGQHDEYSFSSTPETHIHHIMHIHAKKGDPAMSVNHVSHHMSEHEVVVDKATNLKHHGYEDYYDEHNNRQFRIHHMSIDN